MTWKAIVKSDTIKRDWMQGSVRFDVCLMVHGHSRGHLDAKDVLWLFSKLVRERMGPLNFDIMYEQTFLPARACMVDSSYLRKWEVNLAAVLFFLTIVTRHYLIVDGPTPLFMYKHSAAERRKYVRVRERTRRACVKMLQKAAGASK